jgi:hypothetical protein
MAVSLKWRKLWDLTGNLKFCENEQSDPQFLGNFEQKFADIIQNPLENVVVKVRIGLLPGCLG